MNQLYQMPNPEIPGWMSLDELRHLYELAHSVEHVIEVGSWFGRSAHALCAGCPGCVTVIDHGKGSPDERETTHAFAKTGNVVAMLAKNLKHFRNLNLLALSSYEAAGLFDKKSVDLVFIDATHGYKELRSDLRLWMPVAKKIICGHDLDRAPVLAAVNDLDLPWVNRVGTIWEIPL